jgi:heme-degrading monooxygenase HmoA
MFVIRNVFRCKPGQTKNVIEKFKAAMPMMQEVAKHRILVDEVASFWTVIIETETEDMAKFEQMLRDRGSRQDVQDAMKGYMDFVDSGHREIFRVVV